jgi:hypothetical protein
MLCHTSQAAMWPIGRRAVVTIDAHRTPATGV